MSLLNESPQYITVTFSFPPEFRAPLDGNNETVVDVQVINARQTIKIKHWKSAAIADGPWNFSFPHRYSNISVKYRVNLQLFHDGKPLLLEQDHFVIVHQVPHRQTLHVSPIGYLYVEVQEPEMIPADQAITISLHENDSPEVELARVSHDEETATSFYLKYDPEHVVPGKRYALTSIENRYHQQLSNSPGLVELVPPSRAYRSGLLQTLYHKLNQPLRLFTDSLRKIR
ncbi:hypothetical protein CFN16_04975 [Pseudomonas fluorescens]|uniref:Uncharacterized protein n=1 Tax=Pseudomonas fluorescens TaxID=294 RepID=A0A345USP9_PSEFL|nr:hypothetical protein [Pseudomonas fluorescens]AXJ03501.1 hypothetical protein CFN16_04975 [Pseudomonas fluorescens]WJK11047.1 hypothetical protein QR290_06820 [Pseudomonas fluorescens]